MLKKIATYLLITLVCFSGFNGMSLAKTSDNQKVLFIAQLISSMEERNIYSLRQKELHNVVLSRDGHQVIVFNAQKKMVTDPLNRGRYNYASPKTDPLEHFTMDIYPWAEFGSTPQDPSSRSERSQAFVRDFLAALDVLRQQPKTWWKKAPAGVNIGSAGVGWWQGVLDEPAFQKYLFDGSDAWVKDSEQYQLFRQQLQITLLQHLPVGM